MAKMGENKWELGAKLLYIRDGYIGFAVYSPADTDQFESDKKINDGLYHSVALRYEDN